MQLDFFPLRRYARTASCLLIVGLVIAAGSSVHAQERAGESATISEEDNPYGSGAGFQILLTNYGFGLGGYFHKKLNQSASVMTEINLGAGKDEGELKFFRFGSSFIPNKANYLLMLPVQAGVLHRLFRETIEDNFRPYVQITAGPTLGWEYPYFDDTNENGRHDGAERTYDSIGSLLKGDVRLGVGGTLALGAHFGLSRKVTQGVRIGYSFTHFFQAIQLLEEDVQDAQHFFGTPTITLTFGKLLGQPVRR